MPIDLESAFGPGGWALIEFQIWRGADPSPKDLARSLRGSQPVPPTVRKYIAGLLDGSRKRKRGRKAVKASQLEALRFRAWRAFESEKRRLRAQQPGRRAVRDEALASAAANFRPRLSEAQFDVLLYPRLIKRQRS